MYLFIICCSSLELAGSDIEARLHVRCLIAHGTRSIYPGDWLSSPPSCMDLGRSMSKYAQRNGCPDPRRGTGPRGSKVYETKANCNNKDEGQTQTAMWWSVGQN